MVAVRPIWVQFSQFPLSLLGEWDFPYLDVPFDMAMEEENAWVVGLEAQDGIGVGIDMDDVPPRWLGGETIGAAWVVTCPATWTVHDLELVPVEVEWVDGAILVVDDDVNNVVVAHDEGVDGAVDQRVGVGVACCGCSVQGWDLLRYIWLSIDARSGVEVNTVGIDTNDKKGRSLPGDAVHVSTEGKVHGQCLGHRSPCAGIIVRCKSRVILGTERADDIRGEGQILVHHQLAGEVIGPCRECIVDIIPIYV